MFYEERYCLTSFHTSRHIGFNDTIRVSLKEEFKPKRDKKNNGIPRVAPDRYRWYYDKNSSKSLESKYKSVKKLKKIRRGLK